MGEMQQIAERLDQLTGKLYEFETVIDRQRVELIQNVKDKVSEMEGKHQEAASHQQALMEGLRSMHYSVGQQLQQLTAQVASHEQRLQGSATTGMTAGG